MKILSFFLLLKIVCPSAGELLTGNDDISNESLLLNKRALPSEFDKEPRFKWSPGIQGPSGILWSWMPGLAQTVWVGQVLNNQWKSFLNALNAIMKGAAGQHGANDDDGDMHKREGLHIPQNQDLISFLSSV